ncbi:DegV family protein [Herbinix luporum]|jgi:DegV family protein with EDD domain|uniref:DegV family protein n=1 Tax=Herbinix luporum TaxID=1679721 RepID=UPI0017697BE7|nr:DegV family protein [Herbinix luporum]HHT56816.1 DegV family protein [Herbinix luporum]
MSSVKIVTDSTCDLSHDLLELYDISVLPLMISMGEITKKDGLELVPEEIYRWSDETGQTPKTAAPTIGDAVSFLEPFVNAGLDIIFFGISESMSATCNVIRLAAQNLNYDKVYVVDSKNLSTGIGLQVLRAAKMAKKGSTVLEILNDNSEIKDKVRASFVVNTLTYLHRGGRCSGVTALLANTLKLKPEIMVTEGKMVVGKKYRGNIKSALLKYVHDKEKQLLNADNDRVFITHSGCDQEIIEEIRQYLEDLNIFKEILITRAGGVISSHCGPNTLGVLYISK